MNIVLNSKGFWKIFYNLIYNIPFSIKRNLIVFFLLIYFQAFTQIPEYYEDIDFSLSSEDLYNDLSQLVTTSQTGLSYSAIWNLLQQADLEPEDETLTNLLLIYGFDDEDGISSTDRSRDKDLNCNFSGNCVGYWNREHVFPQSLANPPMTTNSIGTGTDAHNLRACDVQANSQRGNNKFAGGSGDPFYGGVDNYYPGDEWRGDIARIILYMYLRYQEECLPLNVGSGSATYSVNIPDIFLEWNVIDTVSDFEIQRNEVIYQIQGNRNPFIDNPYLASLLWGGPTAQNTWPLDGSDIVLDFEFNPVNEINYQDYITSSPLNPSNSFEIAEFIIRDGGDLAELDGLETKMNEISFFVNGHENINKAALFIDGINISETIVNSQLITFDDFLIVVPDGEHMRFNLYVSFKETVLDNEQIIFRITETNITNDSTPFAFRNAGGASSPNSSEVNKIQVVANQLEFIQEPTSVNLQSLMQPYPEVIAVDVFGNRDMDFNDFLALTTTSIFTENSVTSIQSQNGQAIFDQLYFDLVGEDFLIKVSSSNTEIPEKDSNTFTVFEAPVVMTAGKVFITEVSDNPTFSLEYLEIFNNSGRHITLSEAKLVMYPEGTVWGFGASSGNSIPNGVIPPRGFAIISRGGSVQDFESYYGSLNSNTIFIQGTTAMFFAPETPREWKLYQGGTTGLANGHLIDQTTSFGVSNNQRISKNVFDNNFEYSNSLLSNPGELDDLIFTDGNWVNDLSPDINSSSQNVYLFDDFTLSQTISSQNAGIAAPYILNLNGFDFNVSQIFTFKSNSSGSAQLNEIQTNETINGQVTIERYIPARRGFRFLSSAVSTTGSIGDNWQEGAGNATANPSPGYGTHITGSVSGLNGFDATPTGNPSLFMLNNIAQSWESVSNTDINAIVAGTPYRLMVRGDRSIDVTNNSATPTNTTLRTTGTLHTGSFTTSDFSSTAGAFNFFGNPYPSVVDMTSVVGASTNINPNHYYVWDPTLGGVPIPGEPGGRGAYVAVDLTSGGNNNAGSQANQYLQPGQAAFVKTLNNGASSLTFEESHKAVSQSQTQVFNVFSEISMMLYGANNFAAGGTSSDGLRIKFSEEGNNAVTPEDALKFYNLDENIATQNANQLLSIESRALPQDEEVIPLFSNQYRYSNYVLEIDVNELTGVIAYLRDHYTGDQVALSNDQTTLYGFTIDPSIAESISSDRFDIKFEQEVLSTIDIDRSNIVLFPNPAKEVVYLIARSMEGEQVNVWLINMLGQRLYTKSHKINDDGVVTIDTSRLRRGVYLLKLRGNNGLEFKTKLIIE